MSKYEDYEDDLGTSLLGMSGLKLNMTPLPRKNMTTREILEHRLANYDDDMELKTPYYDPELEFDGHDLYVRRNGVEFDSWPAMSGQPGYQNRASTSVSDHGPTPEGVYYVDPKNLQERKGTIADILNAVSQIGNIELSNTKEGLRNILKNYRWKDKPESWGNYRVPLEADDGTDTHGRHSMYIHGGDELGSAGCIDVGPNMDRLAPYIKSSRSPVKVRVRYKDENFER